MTPISRDRFDVLGIPIDATTPERAVAFVGESISRGEKAKLVFCTVSSVLSARKDPAVKEALASATLVAPDGMPLVWLGRRAGYPVERVYGPDFMLDLMARTEGAYRHFFYGSAPGVAETMAARLKDRFPGLVVAGWHSPSLELNPVSPPLEDIALINEAAPDIVWVGLGHPKQDLWIHHNRDRLAAPILAAVGAAFDFHSGRVKEAPRWMKRNGLQWVHRLLKDPKRLWRRYLVGNPLFVALLVKEYFIRRTSRRRDQ